MSEEISEVKVKRISIDCDPFSPRPEVYMNHIWKNILNKGNSNIPEPISRFFGCWIYEVPEYDKSTENKIKDYLVDCYNKGLIRYASW